MFLQSMGIPCFLGGMSRGLLGRNSPIHIRQQRRDALKEADLVILAGNSHFYIWRGTHITCHWTRLRVYFADECLYFCF